MFKIEKKKFESNVEMKSEWNMTNLDFQRIDSIFQDIDANYYKCAKGKWKYVTHYLSSLKAFYRYIRPMMNGKEKTRFDSSFSITKKLGNTTKGFEHTEKLHDSLMIKRQFLGMGIFASKNKKIAEEDLKDDL